MKKLLLLSTIAIIAVSTQAQDFKKVTTAVLINKMADAKNEIDKLSIDPKALAKAEYWYFRSKIYASFVKDAEAMKKYPTLITDVDNAIKKLIELDPNFTLVKERSSDAIFDMYSYGFNNGIRSFNEKKWDSASYYFGYAVTYSDFLFQNKLTKDTKMAFDTTSILYAGYSAQNATKATLACKYYTRLADAKVSTDGYADVYKYLVLNYMNEKNETDFNKYLALAKVAFPKENWGDYEVEYIDRNFSLDQKVNYFNKADAAGTMTEMQYLQFGEIFIGVKRDNKEKTKYDSTQLEAFEKKGIDAYKKAFGKNAENAIASYNIGVIYYNNFGLVDDQIAANIKSLQQINSTKPVEKDPKKKAALDAKFKLLIDPILKSNQDLEKPINENLDNAIEWLEKTIAIENAKKEKNSTDKSICNKSVDFLANMFAYKRDRLRGKDPKAFDAFDAKYKQYDILHGKF